MLVIRFQRVGRRNDPSFRVVVTERRSKPKSGELEILGSYHPKTKVTALKAERILYWISKGAQCSSTVHNLLISKEVIQGKKVNVAPEAKITAEPAPAAMSEKPVESQKSEVEEISVKPETEPATPVA